jgi:hypothetical protein
MSRFRLTALLGTAAGICCLAAPTGLLAHGLPSHAEPGQCYGKVYSPAVYETTSHKVLAKKAWTETRKVPAVVERTSRKVLVHPETIERFHTPPTYRTVVDWIEHPGEVRRVTEAARYETVREKVQVEAGHAEWRRQSAPLAYGETASGQTLVQPTGEIVCRVWVPARYEMVEHRVMVSPARTYEVTGPSHREKVVRRELVSPGGTREKRRPAVYRTEYSTKVVRPATVKTIQHPAVYRTVRSRTLVRPAHQTWSRLQCHPHVVHHAAPPPPPPPPHVCNCTYTAAPPPPPPPPPPHPCNCTYSAAPPPPPPPQAGITCGQCTYSAAPPGTRW